MGCGKSKAADKDETAAEGEAAKTEDSGPKVIVVFGATDVEGSSVVKAMKADGQFKVKAATGDPDSDKAKALAEEGIDVVKVDLDDVESIKQALQDVYGVFLVTDYWEILDADREVQQGKNVVDAAKDCGVQHLVFSGLKSAKEAIGKDAAHMESKAAIGQYIADQGVPFTIVRYAVYYENLLSLFAPKKNDNHEYVLNLPMGDQPLDMVCVSEAGECVHQIFAQAAEYKGQTIGLCSQSVKLDEYAAILSKAFDTKKFVAGNISIEDFAKEDVRGADNLAIMFEFYQSGKCDHDIELTRRLNPAIPTFEQWVDSNRDAFDAALE